MDDGRRWNWDGKYTGKGRLWALLSGERGQYELAKCGISADTRNEGSWNPAVDEIMAREPKRLDAMLGFANEGLMIPEQVWDRKETPERRPAVRARAQIRRRHRFGDAARVVDGAVHPARGQSERRVEISTRPTLFTIAMSKTAFRRKPAISAELTQTIVLPVKAGEKFSLSAAPCRSEGRDFFDGKTKLCRSTKKASLRSK